MLALNRAIELTPSGPIRFAALMHDSDTNNLQNLMKRYRIPKEFSELAILSCQYTQAYNECLQMDAKTLLTFIKNTDALRRPNRFNNFLMACHACIDDDLNEQRDLRVNKAIIAVQAVDIEPLQAQDLKGQDFAAALQELQITAVEEVIH